MVIVSCFVSCKTQRNIQDKKVTGNSEPITEIERLRCGTEQSRRRSAILEDTRSLRCQGRRYSCNQPEDHRLIHSYIGMFV